MLFIVREVTEFVKRNIRGVALIFEALYTNDMAFNHYAKMKRILAAEPEGWIIRRIDEPTTAKSFKGEVREFDHYYRIYSSEGTPIKYCKFQQLDRLAAALSIPIEALPVVDDL